MTSWQDKFKKSDWQTRFTKPSLHKQLEESYKRAEYKIINKEFYYKHAATIWIDEATWWAGSFFLKGSIFLKKDGRLDVFVRAYAPIKEVPQTDIQWDVQVEVKINDTIFQRKSVTYDPKIPRLLPLDNFTTIGDISFKLPRPHPMYKKIFIIIKAEYIIDTGNGLIQPIPKRMTRKIPIEIIEKLLY